MRATALTHDRDPDEIETTVGYFGLLGDLSNAYDEVRRLEEAGADRHGPLRGPCRDDRTMIRRLHETYEHMRRLNGQPTKLAASSDRPTVSRVSGCEPLRSPTRCRCRGPRADRVARCGF